VSKPAFAWGTEEDATRLERRCSGIESENVEAVGCERFLGSLVEDAIGSLGLELW